MFGLGTPELIVILGIAFLVFGGKKLPEIGAGLGKGISYKLIQKRLKRC
jgi:sec-independent protein translocase protein TatA